VSLLNFCCFVGLWRDRWNLGLRKWKILCHNITPPPPPQIYTFRGS
jgi:hypothetical protein